MSERKRTSRCDTGAAISLVVHHTRAGLPGSSVASTIVWPLSVVRLVIKPGSMRTFAWLPGRSRVSNDVLAGGTGTMKEARPASTVSADAMSSETENGPGPLRMAACLCPSCNRSEEHTSELQSLAYLVCRLLLEKKKNNIRTEYTLSH